jgi:threonine dehydratase
MTLPTYKEVREAHERIRPFVHRTPVMTSTGINKICGAEVFFKCENFQKVGAFKFRGAMNAVLNLSDEILKNGVTTHSSGNHAAALALAASMRGVPAYIIMPDNSPQVKKDAVAGYGAEITWCKPSLEARESTMELVRSKTGAVFIHPYNHPHIIAGQGTAAKELLEDNDLDIIMAPVGGGGLMSGTCLSARAMKPSITIYGAEPKAADDAFRSLASGVIIPSVNPVTIADGLLTSLGDLTFGIIRTHINEIITVSEENIRLAMMLIWERMKIVTEPSGAVPLAAILENKSKFEGRKVGIIISGGNYQLS